MSNIDKRALRKAAMHAKTEDDWGCDADNFHDKATPDAVLALLDELEAAEKRIAELESNEIREDGNQFLVVRTLEKLQPSSTALVT
ncbi:ead/Ea22-like family protein [Citrobacter freundii]|uniref:ead/Ea22-like family protein n=1 Tax=Citrobacter freundii TaxID=546 RepID=UPI0040419D27